MQKLPLGDHLKAVIVTAAAILVSACGGGGGGGQGTTQTEPAPLELGSILDPAGPSPVPPAAVTPGAPSLQIACTGCAAGPETTYVGVGPAIWAYENTSAAEITVPVYIKGLSGQEVTYMITNSSAVNISAPSRPASLQVGASTPSQSVVATQADRIAEFNRVGWAGYVGERTQPSSVVTQSTPAPVRFVVGASRNFYHVDDVLRATTLVRQMPSRDGRLINFWLESGEGGPTKVSDDLLDRIVAAYAPSGALYDSVARLAGAPWGPHPYTNDLIDQGNSNVDVVMLNFNRDSRPYGLVGYFFGRNAFKKTVIPTSNESISLYIDTETIYGALDGVDIGISALVHEGTHMANFYRRAVTMGPQFAFDLWAEEMSAMMTEDILSSAGPLATRSSDRNLMGYLAISDFYCGVTTFDASVGTRPCFGYAQVGAFGSYLLRAEGLKFYSDFMSSPESGGQVAVERILRADGGKGLVDRIQLFQTAVLAGLRASDAPAEYGFPARSDGAFALSAVDPALYHSNGSFSSWLHRDQVLAPGGAIAINGVARTPSIYDEVRVPAGARLTVVAVH